MQTEQFVSLCRDFGKSRIGVAASCRSQEDWKTLWKPSEHPFTFKAGQCWNFTAEYKVVDFEAEVGFFIDLLGFDANAIDSSYAMFMVPEGKYYFSIVKASPTEATPPEAIRLEFMLADIKQVTSSLIDRGIVLEQSPQPFSEGSNLYRASLRTPNGIQLALWGILDNE